MERSELRPAHRYCAHEHASASARDRNNIMTGPKDRNRSGSHESEVVMDIHEWKAALEQERKDKDIFFATHWQSPLPMQDRSIFMGLAYFPPNGDYTFNLQLNEHQDPSVLEIQDTTGNIRQFLRWGEFRFKVGDQECTLQAYKRAPQQDQLFVPFKDVTNDKDTYGPGRYIDLDGARDRTADGNWVLDFNRAYNPWCAYSMDYSCPYVPPENWLEVPVLAGEKKYPINDAGQQA